MLYLLSSVSLIIEQSVKTPFHKLLGDHFGVRSENIWGSFRGRDHFRVNLGSVRGWGSFRGRDHFGGCTDRLSASCNDAIHDVLHYNLCDKCLVFSVVLKARRCKAVTVM